MSDSEHGGKRKKRRNESREGGSVQEGTPDWTMCTPQLKNSMMELILNIMRKDQHMIFAEPVSDIIAPGYSSIISKPMDLSSMQAKVQRGEYTSLRDLKEDADLMCKNCMVYNSDDTIFYKEAVKLQIYIASQFGEKRNKAAVDDEVREGIRKKNRIQEGWAAEEISRSVKKAARGAKERLEREAGDTRVGYLTEDKEGTVLLNILNPPAGEPTEKPVDMSFFEPHENTTTSLLNNFREKKREPNKPPEYLHYGPFGSFMPSYDSVFSSLDDADQQLLYSCYGNETGLAYCRSVQEFARGCHDSLRQPVDDIINALTGGGHVKANRLLAQKYAKIIREKRVQRAKRLGKDKQGGGPAAVATDPVPPQVREEESLLKLLESDDLPDILEDVELQERLEQACEDVELQDKLDKTSSLLMDLHQEQNYRLSKPSETESKTAVWEIKEKEQDIAEQVQDNLKDMLSDHVTPGFVVSQDGVRDAMSSDLVDQVSGL